MGSSASGVSGGRFAKSSLNRQQSSWGRAVGGFYSVGVLNGLGI